MTKLHAHGYRAQPTLLEQGIDQYITTFQRPFPYR